MFAGLDVVQTHYARRWTAIASFTFQAALVGAALILPLLKPESLPEAFARRPIFRPLSRGVEHPVANQDITHNNASQAPVYPLIVNRAPRLEQQVLGPRIQWMWARRRYRDLAIRIVTLCPAFLATTTPLPCLIPRSQLILTPRPYPSSWKAI